MKQVSSCYHFYQPKSNTLSLVLLPQNQSKKRKGKEKYVPFFQCTLSNFHFCVHHFFSQTISKSQPFKADWNNFPKQNREQRSILLLLRMMLLISRTSAEAPLIHWLYWCKLTQTNLQNQEDEALNILCISSLFYAMNKEPLLHFFFLSFSMHLFSHCK